MTKKIIKIFLILLVLTSVRTQLNIKNIVKEINKNQKLELNVLINFDKSTKNPKHFEELLQLEDIPKMIIKERPKNITSLAKYFTQQILTIAWLTEATLNITISYIDQLLWTIHFKDIILIYQENKANKLNKDKLLNIFRLCSDKGFTSLLLWHNDNHVYTYHPYPDVQIKQIFSMSEYHDKRHLLNFQGKVIHVPFFQFPPSCFSYTNYKGEHLRVGYLYKTAETFFTHYNATYDHQFHDLWAYNTVQRHFSHMNETIYV